MSKFQAPRSRLSPSEANTMPLVIVGAVNAAAIAPVPIAVEAAPI